MLYSTFSELVLYFFLYGFIGWIVDTTAASVKTRKFVNRGFLQGPFCPVYGFGAIAILSVTIPFSPSWGLVFLAAVLISFAIWTFSTWFSNKVLQWQYIPYLWMMSAKNLIIFTLLFGGTGLLGVYVVHPTLRRFVGVLEPSYQRVLASVLIVFFVLDFLYSLDLAAGLGERLKKLKQYLSQIDHYEIGTKWFDPNDLPGSVNRLRDMCQKEENGQAAEILKDLDDILGRQDRSLRLLRAYPQGIGNTWEGLHDYWESNRESLNKRLKNKAKNLGRKTVSAAKELNPFRADGISFYKMVWIFTIASVLGYLIETVWCLITNGVIESRQGMIYGPFNQVYGFGAVLMALLLRPFAKKNDRWLFFGGALVGGAFEWVCSWLQEKAFGTVSWEYSGHALSVGGGRTSLLYMFFWGILGVFFMKSIYPRISRSIERIPKRSGIVFSWILVVGLTANMLISAAAVYRWSNRVQGAPAQSTVEVFLDDFYPDEKMKDIYPNMQ
ncbi:MAG: putative ABC transporter permease [Oscillospiraceae bacterium]|jgi:uncharacterized membrane protein|nr:putative ABC transporter permease [Oscillospiraceae bacterium]